MLKLKRTKINKIWQQIYEVCEKTKTCLITFTSSNLPFTNPLVICIPSTRQKLVQDGFLDSSPPFSSMRSQGKLSSQSLLHYFNFVILGLSSCYSPLFFTHVPSLTNSFVGLCWTSAIHLNQQNAISFFLYIFGLHLISSQKKKKYNKELI